MKMIAGDFSLAKAKASRTSLAPSPVIRDRVLVFQCQAEGLDFRVHASHGRSSFYHVLLSLLVWP